MRAVLLFCFLLLPALVPALARADEPTITVTVGNDTRSFTVEKSVRTSTGSRGTHPGGVAQLGQHVGDKATHGIAVGRGSPTVDVEDNAHALDICERSFDAMADGIDIYMRDYYDFPKFCDEVGAAFSERGFISKRDLHRAFFRRQRQGFELERVITELVKQERIEWTEHAPPTGGTTAKGWTWVGDE